MDLFNHNFRRFNIDDFIGEGTTLDMSFKIDVFKESLTCQCKYEKCDICTSHFYLNRDFTVKSIQIDDKNFFTPSSLVKLDVLEGYLVRKFQVPKFSNTLIIEFEGYLTGDTGCCPYVKETINENFTFIRWETFCYPMFIEDTQESLFKYLTISGYADISVEVPYGYEAIASEKLTSKKENIFYFNDHKAAKYNFNCAIAKYKELILPTGIFYLLNGSFDSDMLIEVMDFTSKYMNSHFGYRDIKSNTKYVSIPDGYGSFTCEENDTIFIQESTFSSKKNMNQIIHEFTHLGWNAKAEGTVSRSRFFDEAFTSYYEMRIMNALERKEHYLDLYSKTWNEQMNSGKYKEIPIHKFGEYEYGDLSYTAGAICLYELTNIISENIFDNITTQFLNEFKNKPTTFEDFCNFYIDKATNDKKQSVKKLFDDWIYSCEGFKKYIKNT